MSIVKKPKDMSPNSFCIDDVLDYIKHKKTKGKKKGGSKPRKYGC